MSGKAIKRVLFAIVIATALFALQAVSVSAQDSSDLNITGGQQGTDYTYQDGVLRILKQGTYSIGMASGVSSTTDRIVVAPPDGASGQTFNFTFDNLNLSNTTDSCFLIENREQQRDKVNIVLQGDNSFSTEESSKRELTPFTCNRTTVDMTVSGGGMLLLTAPKPVNYGDGNGFFNPGTLTIESGTIICKNDCMMAEHIITINGGTVDISDGYDGIYVPGQFVLNKGTVTINSLKYGIQVTGAGPDNQQQDGVIIQGGTLDITATGDMGKGISLGDPENASVQKNIRLAMPGTVKIKATKRGTGIAAANTNAKQKMYMSNGELEITTSNYIGSTALLRIIAEFDEGYTHQSYGGTTASDRQPKPDFGTNKAGLINPNTDNCNFTYALITPAYPITYELNGGALEGGVTNPERYTRVDSFTLNNPVKEDADFAGWAGTGISGMSASVTVEEGSTGARFYLANFKKDQVLPDVTGKTLTYNGTEQNGVPESDGYTVQNGTAKDAGSYTATVTPKEGYCWEDGTKDAKEVTYQIEKAKLTASYASETIPWYGEPKLEVKVTGFVGGETASTAAGYKAPSMKKPETAPHKSYTLEPAGGEAKNYTFTYKAGTLNVKCRDIILVTAKTSGRTVTLTWNKVSGATMFEIHGSPCGVGYKVVKTIDSGSTLKYTVKGLKKKAYKYYVVAYRVADGKKTKLATSEGAHVSVANAAKGKANAKKIKLNKKSLTIKKGKSSKVKAKVTCSKGKKLFWKSHCGKVRYYTSDVHIAKVSKKGKITGVAKGKCKIYAVTPNGFQAAVTVTVK